jgi:hypothetical protein
MPDVWIYVAKELPAHASLIEEILSKGTGN